MKLGEIIDYMMENEIVSTIKTNDGNIIINGKMHGRHSNIPNSNTLYMLIITLNTAVITYKVLELSNPDWERINHSILIGRELITQWTERQNQKSNIVTCLIYMKMHSEILKLALRNLIVLQTSVKGANIKMRIL